MDVYTLDTVEDWQDYILDEDEDNTWCKWDEAQYKVWFKDATKTARDDTPYRCTSIVCYQMRKVQTTDTAK